MRPIYLATIEGKTRPAVILTREAVRGRLSKVTVAPITSTIRGLATEVPVGPENGLDHSSVVSCDNIITISQAALSRYVGVLKAAQEEDLGRAIVTAFDLEV